jgi:hypothetical protein
VSWVLTSGSWAVDAKYNLYINTTSSSLELNGGDVVQGVGIKPTDLASQSHHYTTTLKCSPWPFLVKMVYILSLPFVRLAFVSWLVTSGSWAVDCKYNFYINTTSSSLERNGGDFVQGVGIKPTDLTSRSYHFPTTLKGPPWPFLVKMVYILSYYQTKGDYCVGWLLCFLVPGTVEIFAWYLQPADALQQYPNFLVPKKKIVYAPGRRPPGSLNLTC